MPEPNRDVASALEALRRLGGRLAGGQSPDDAGLDMEALRRDSAAFTAYLGDLVREDRFRDWAAEPLDLAALDDAERWATALGAFHLLAVGAVALALAPLEDPKTAGRAVADLAMTRHPIGKEARTVVLPGPKPEPPVAEDVFPKLPERFKTLLVHDALGTLVARFAICGTARRTRTGLPTAPTLLGRVLRLSPNPACGGGMLEVAFAGFGPPPPAGCRLSLVLPTMSGPSYVFMDEAGVSPNLEPPGAWRDAGSVTLPLPTDVTSGPVGFVLFPPVDESESTLACAEAAIAAQDLAGVMLDIFGRHAAGMAGHLIGFTSRFAGAVDYVPTPQPTAQPGDSNWLFAGRPIIRLFRRQGSGFLHPARTLEVEWETENATGVRFEVAPVADSENPPTLKASRRIFAPNGKLAIPLAITSRWLAKLVLVATNGHGCGETRAEIELDSGFTDYRLGVGKADVTCRTPGVPLQGFACDFQFSSGELLQDRVLGVPPIPLQARAFVIETVRARGPRRCFILIVADIWSGSEGVKREVLARLRRRLPGLPIDHDSVMVTGTHTHSAPGGYLDHFLYNMSGGGFVPDVFERIVDGMVRAVEQAVASAAPGRLWVARAPLRGCGGQRSMPAWLRNPGARPGTAPGDAIDPEMLVLRFDRHRRSATAPDARVPIGMVSWFGLHPTNIGMFNVDISGDNKGWASFVTERDRGAHAFVAAFANAAAGDVSGNLDGGIPVGGANNPDDRDLSLLRRDIARMVEAGQRQADHARTLFDGPMEEVRGEIALAHSFVDMASVVLPSGQRTWPAMLGVSFGAGSSEDGFPRIVESVLPLVGTRFSLDSGIVEGIDKTTFLSHAAAAGFHLAVVLGGGLAAVGLLNGLVDPRLRSTVMALAGKVAFGLRLNDARFRPADDARFSYHWEVPAFAHPHTEAGQGAKPILFPVGEVVLRRVERGTGATDFFPCPLVPHVVPLQLVKIGQVVIAGVPGEFNAQAGLRLKERLRRAFGLAAHHYAVAGYANAYAGYVATEAEYAAQHYEGASTLYGPHTLEAYCHCFVRMAERMVDTTRPGLPPGLAYTPPVLHRRP